MENFTLVRTEHLNHYGMLFGGVLLKWVDEFAWLAASREYPNCRLVTIGMDAVEFKQQVQNGAVLRFDIRFQSQGKTSVKYDVQVYSKPPDGIKENSVFTTQVTFVRIDPDGNKCTLPQKSQSA